MGQRLGQHFLTNIFFAKKLASSVAIREGETILEIGPGKGALTKELLATGARVVAVEKDEALVEILRSTFASDIASGKLTVISEDVRNFDPSALGEYVLAANIPYYITGEIIRQFLTALHQPRAMALLIQKEVAERIIARDGKESILSLSVKVYGTPKIVAKVSKGNFNPPPNVDSAILLVDSINRDFFTSIDELRFFDVVKTGFSSKRKMLQGNLGKFGKEKVSGAFENVGIPTKARAEDLPLEKWGRLASLLS